MFINNSFYTPTSKDSLELIGKAVSGKEVILDGEFQNYIRENIGGIDYLRPKDVPRELANHKNTIKIQRNYNSNLYLTSTDKDKIGVDPEFRARIYAESWNHWDKISENNLKDFSINKNNGLNKEENSISLVDGVDYQLPDGNIIKWTKNNVVVILNDKTNFIDQDQAKEKAFILHHFTRIANKEMQGLSFDRNQNFDSKITAEILQGMGIDLNKDFYINGKKFWYDKKSETIQWQPDYIPTSKHLYSNYIENYVETNKTENNKDARIFVTETFMEVNQDELKKNIQEAKKDAISSWLKGFFITYDNNRKFLDF